MKTSYILPLLVVCALPSFSVRAIDFKEAKFTEIVDDVKVISAADKTVVPAAINEIFKMPDVLRTGPDSRAELVADDQTVTRVGANTIFSFDPANRTVDLKQGSLLFHSPHGKGGGTIQTGSATASVLGTTIIVSTTPNGGFKVLVLEGKAKVALSGIVQNLNAGQMIYVLPGGGISPIVVFRLDEETKGSKLVGGFKNPLGSLGLINKAIGGQLKQIKNGQAVDTGLLAGDTATSGTIEAIPAATIQALVENVNTTPPAPSGADLALQTDFTINSSTLDVNNIFPAGLIGIGFNITTDPNGFLGGSGLANPFFGFPGHNITINTPTIDLSPYVAQPKFQILALNNLDVQSSLTVNGLTSANEFDLAAGNQLTIASGSSLEADCGLFWLGGFQPITLDNVSLYNDGGGGVSLVSGSALTLQNNSLIQANTEAFLKGASVDIENSSVEGNSVDIESSSTLMLNNNSSATAFSGSATLNAGTDLTVDSSSVTGNGGTTLSAGGNVLLNNAVVTENSSGITVSSDNNLTASGTTTLTALSGQVSLSAFDLVSLSGATINSSDFALTDYGSDPVLGTAVAIDNSQITGGNGINLNSYNGSMTIQNNSQLNTPNGALNAESEGSMTVDNSTLSGVTGLSLTSDNSDLMLQNNASLTSSGGDINITGGQFGTGNVLVDNSSLNGLDAFVNSPNQITLQNGANITVNNDITVNAGTDLLLDDAILGNTSSSSTGTTTLGGDSSVTIANSSSVENGSVGIQSASGTVDINNHSTVTSDTGDITVEANTDTTIDTATLHSFDNLYLYADNGGLTLNTATISAPGSASLNGKSSVNIGNTGITAGSVDVESSSGAITVNNNSSITANSGDIIMNAHADLTVDNATLTGNNNNNVTLTSANNDLSLNNDAISSVITATLSGKTSVTFAGGSLNANAAAFHSANGSVTINSAATIAANTITLTAGDGITLDNVTMSGSLPSTPGALTATAVNTIDVGKNHSVDITGLASISMNAKTINLYGVIFNVSGVYNFDCANGAISIGSVVTGDVNFLNNCSIGPTLITLPSQIDVTTAASASPGIHVY